MRSALAQQGTLGAPGVGHWWPSVGVGAPLSPGQLLGRLERAGDIIEVRAPKQAAGMAATVAESGSWVEYGSVLVGIGEVSLSGAGPLATEARASDVPEDVLEVCAETDGTIYLRANPETPPFVVVGAEVAAMATLALVEVMKTFTPVRASIPGEVVRVCVDDGASVEAGETLFWLRGA